MLCGFFLIATLLIAAQRCRADQPNGSPDEAALKKRAAAFVEAFHNGDAKALAAFWTADGDYIDQTGRRLKGREAIQKAFETFFEENKGLKLRINVASIRFPTPEVAVEDGMTDVMPPDGGPPSRARYTNVHVKRDGEWYLSSVRDAVFSPPTNYEFLRGLEWAIGDWAADSDKGEIARISFDWADNQNFITSSFTTTFKNITVGGGIQWIGWDPAAKHIRSWTFDESGGFGEGRWTNDGDRWTIKTNSLLRDGKKITATHVVTRIDADTLTWQSKERSVDGKPLPDIKEITMKRTK
jgi:uncharacterized protein (TIGR02246 family)